MNAPAGVVAAFLLLCAPLHAQQPGAETTKKPEGRYLRLDFFVGGARYDAKAPAGEEPGQATPGTDAYGWDTGATVSVAVPWLGFTGSVGHHAPAGVPAYHVLAGPTLSSGWGGDGVWARGFLHVLGGFAKTSDAARRTSGEFAAGVGMDIMPLFLRVQFDEVWLNVEGVTKGYGRVFAGAVVPLCFNKCRENDLWDVSRKK